MKQETKDFGTRTKWVELGKDITKLRNKTDDLDLAFTRVSVKLDELFALSKPVHPHHKDFNLTK